MRLKCQAFLKMYSLKGDGNMMSERAVKYALLLTCNLNSMNTFVVCRPSLDEEQAMKLVIATLSCTLSWTCVSTIILQYLQLDYYDRPTSTLSLLRVSVT